MADVTGDTPAFEHTGDIANIPLKDDVKTNKAIADETDRINRTRVQETVRIAMGEQPEKPKPQGTMTKDCPQIVFRIIAGVIGCEKFNLDDNEAATMAEHLNVLIPLSGKAASVVIILMITLNKVYVCMDAIKAKLGRRAGIEQQPDKPQLPEPLR